MDGINPETSELLEKMQTLVDESRRVAKKHDSLIVKIGEIHYPPSVIEPNPRGTFHE